MAPPTLFPLEENPEEPLEADEETDGEGNVTRLPAAGSE
jgi:hypothetical protein